MEKASISIIIVNYKVEKHLFDCLSSIENHLKKISYEVIVVENDPDTNLTEKLKKFSKLKYVGAKKNNGFGAGNNLGAKYARGEFLFFLNPDTEIKNGSIVSLLEMFEDEHVGVVAPLLIDFRGKPFQKQGTLKLTPINAFFSQSFVYKYFPNNPIANKFWIKSWNKKSVKEVDVVPGTAFIIRRDLFKKLGGFDEKFFLYFEENDLCNRANAAGYKNFISPKLKVFHAWGKSTQQEKNIETIFEKSRSYYFQKYYGVVGVLTDLFIGKNLKTSIIVICVLAVSLFLRIYRLSELMPFIPDQGWFYLSARNMLLTGVIPLVGPPTSHPWIHHGPLWTYALATLLYVFKFNPVAPAYYIAYLGVVTVFLIYFAGSRMFSKKTGLIAGLLFATSPLVVVNSRIPYHTSPIPFFVIILFYLTFVWVKGKPWAFPLITFLLAILYNHEITTFVFDVTIFLIFSYGFFRKKEFLRKTLQPKIFAFAVVFFIIPLIPFIIYDTNHGYKQTVGFLAWLGYRIVKLPISFFNKSFVSKGSNPSTVPEFLSYYTQLVFVGSNIFSSFLLIASVFTSFFILIKKRNTSVILLLLFFSVSIIGLFVHRVPIEADVLLISPFFILLIAVSIEYMMSFKKLKFLTVLIFVIICAGNTYFILTTNYFTSAEGYQKITFRTRMLATEQVIQLAHGKAYNIVGKGNLSSFPVFLDPYVYLLWYKGNAPSEKKENNLIQIWENGNQIIITKLK